MKLAAVVAGTAGLLLFAAPAYAEEVTVPGCVGHPGPLPDFDIKVGDYEVPALADVYVCAFDSATVDVDVDPIEESNNCAYGPAIDVQGVGVHTENFGLAVYYTADGEPQGGVLYQPPFVIDGQTEGYNSGPLWMIPCFE